MKKLIILLMLVVSVSVFGQKKSKDKKIPVYTAYGVGYLSETRIPLTGQYAILGKFYDDQKNGAWFLTSDEDLVEKIKEAAEKGDTCSMIGADLSPFQVFTKKQWKDLDSATKAQFGIKSYKELKNVKFATLSWMEIKPKKAPASTTPKDVVVDNKGKGNQTTTTSDYKLGTVDGVEYVMQTSTGYKWKTQVSNGVRYIWAQTSTGKVDWVKFEGTF